MEVIDLTEELQVPVTAPVVLVKPIGVEYSIDVVDLLDEEENPGRDAPALPVTGASRLHPPSHDGEFSGGDDQRLRKGSKTEGELKHDDPTKKTTKNASRHGRQSIPTTNRQVSTSIMPEVIDISSDESDAEIETGNGRSREDKVSNSSLEFTVFHHETLLGQDLASVKQKISRDQVERVRVLERGLEHRDCSTIGVGVRITPAQQRQVGSCVADSSKVTRKPHQGIHAKSGSTAQEVECHVPSYTESSPKEGSDKVCLLPVVKPVDDLTTGIKSGAVQSHENAVDPPPIPGCINAIVRESVQRRPASPKDKEWRAADKTVQFERNGIDVENHIRSGQKSVPRVEKRSVTKRRRTIDLSSADDNPMCKIAPIQVQPPLHAISSRGSVPTKNAASPQNNGESALKDVIKNEDSHVGEKPASCTTPVQLSREPNFILIDDFSDEEQSTVRRHCRKEIRCTQKTQVCNNTVKGVFLPPYKERILDKKFRPGADFNFDKSMKEALDEQEGLFRQAAASLHLHEEFLRNMKRPRHQRDCPIFTRAVDPSRLHQDHWKWQCAYARLGLPIHASDSIVKKQYRKHALRYHPDKCRLEDASTRFQAVTEAFNKIRHCA